MNPQPGNSWPTPAGSVSGQPNHEHTVPDQPRPLGNFGAPLPPQQARSQLNGPPLVSQPGTFFPGQANGHPLVQGSPMQQNRSAFQQQHSPPSNQHQNVAPGYSLPALNSAVQQQQQSQAAHDIEREQREREVELERRQHQQEAIAQRDYEREIELREQQQREQLPSPLENHTSSIPIQQPVASRIPATLHGPNGILNHQLVGTNGVQNAPSAALGAANGPGNVFVNNMQNAREASPRSFIQQGPQMIPAQQLLNPGGLEATQQLPAALSQGAQQPILNDALSYLDQVKVRFVDHPDVYNRFLDIMKDFKSQAIDTPGVIDRVSSLFAGHPELIQGFNTFLPPGYRIECGTQDDPNAIRVTTPMGTTVSQMPSAPNRFTMGPGPVQALENVMTAIRQGPYVDSQANGEWSSHRNDGVEISENPFAANGRADMPQQYNGQSAATQDGTLLYDREEQLAAAEAAHRQEQRGVSNLSHVASAIATNGSTSQLPLAQVSPPGGQAMTLGQNDLAMSGQSSALAPGNQMGLEKRGPVEFNHAIGYVNKIKNRFQQHPDIYKSFLEILQTYQRESKPIQDVYAQVTQLFSTAPDLLEDFKQFLPESAAQAKAQAAARQATEDAAMLSNVRGDAAYLTGATQRQAHTPRPEMKMPPVGNFAPPPSVGKENKKRRGGAGSQITGGAAALDTGPGTSSQNKSSGMRGASSSKRARIEQAKQPGPEVPPVSPTLVPSLPRPIPPADASAGNADEFAFFDRVRKHVANKSTYNEFLKIINLYNQQMIDRNLLVHKCFSFLGNNIELYTWFKDYIRYDGRDEIVENQPRTASTKVVLSNCRGLGPSYRLVPKAAKLEMKCSGRDQMCHSVLNDDWSSFPTWASEDSGFIAHRKNTFEDALHRCEEERHDYDINIEACLRTIQLIEPIIAQINTMSRADREAYKLPPGIGGMSETIYERVIKKIYGREVGGRVIQDMFELPAAVLPMLVWRLNQKVEEWKASMREWDKVWREQVHRQFWKSLDHQGDRIKQADRRPFQPKTLQNEIQIKYEEQRRARSISSAIVPRYQLKYAFGDVEVIFDTCHLLLTTSYTASSGVAEHSKTENFFNTFMSAFFDLDHEALERRMSDIYDNSPPNEEVEDEHIEEPGPSRGRRITNGRKGTLLRGVLDRRLGQKERDGSAMRNSKETTPDIGSMDDGTVTPSDQSGRADPGEHRWMDHPHGILNHDEPFRRDTFALYASSNIYCFFRLFQMLYERLANIKACEEDVHSEVSRSNAPKPADGLGIQDKKPAEYFNKTGFGANYYRQTLAMCESVARGDIEATTLEDTLRRFYLQKGWQLYNFDKITSATLRYASSILTSDNKDKSLDIANLFYKDRKEDETTHDAELMYRKQVEKLSKDGDIYRITYSRNARDAFIQIFKKDDRTFEIDEMAAVDRWKYYVSSYTMRDQTEGVPPDKTWLPYLRRNLPPVLDTLEEYNRIYKSPQHNQDGLTIRINQESYRIQFDPLTAEWFVHDDVVRKMGLSGMREISEERKKKFQDKFMANPRWMAQMPKEEVQKTIEDAERWIKGSEVEMEKEEVQLQNDGAGNEKTHQDEVMTGA